jgi:MSHA biogenesis protein MshJ
MKEYWTKFAGAIDERPLRERVLILLIACAVVATLLQSLLLEPVLAERKRLVLEAQNDRAEIVKMTSQLHGLARSKAEDPDVQMKTRLAELEARQAQVQRQIDAQSADLVPPEKMSAVLEKLLGNTPRLRLVEIKTLPRSSINIEQGPAKQEAPKAGEAKREPADEKKTAVIYRYGMEVTMRGSYLDFLAYLKEIESLPVRMFWDKLSLSAKDYPNVTMRFIVYTISLEKVWLTV